MMIFDCTIFVVLLQNVLSRFALFCCKLSFGVIHHVLLCGKNIIWKLHRWKMTNFGYAIKANGY